MTKKAFKHAIERGLGSAITALKNAPDPESFRPLVLWACSRDTAYDAQSEGFRSDYLYELITRFPDPAPFLDIIEQRLFKCMHSSSWEFAQDCELLSYFAADGISRSLEILKRCYDTLFQILLKKRRRTVYGLLPERDNFEALCFALLNVWNDKKLANRQRRTIVKDLNTLIQRNSLFSAADFDQLLPTGPKQLQIKTTSPSQMLSQTADEIYRRLKEGEALLQICPLNFARRWIRENRLAQVQILADHYKTEETVKIRYQLLRLLANEACAWTLDVSQLISDSESADASLSSWAFEALSFRRDEKVRSYALELLQTGNDTAAAASMLAANYEDQDKDILTDTVKQLPVSRKDGQWHSVFYDVMQVFMGPAKQKPKELLPYMYRNTLCSCCRERIVREMGRRRMLSKELLEELQFDCNENIRTYALKKIKAGRIPSLPTPPPDQKPE